MKDGDPMCVCGAPLSKHCKGNVEHSDPKEDYRLVAHASRKWTVTCKTRHCLGPLCSCLEFRAALSESNTSMNTTK